MLDKNDRKYIIRRIITYIAIAMIMFIISSCQAHALTQTVHINYIDSGQTPHGYSMTGFYQEASIYRDGYLPPNVPTWEPFIDTGEGNFIFTITARNATSPSNILSNVYVGNDSELFTCDMGSIYTYNDNTAGVMVVTLNCPVFFRNGHGLKKIRVERNGASGTTAWSISHYGTFVSKDNVNVSVNQQQVVSAVESSQTATIQAIESQGGIAHQDAQQAINQAHQDAQQITNSLNDSTPPSSTEISGNANDWNSYNTDNGVINNLVLMPITLLNSFVNGMNNSCSSYDLGELWGEHIILPCINLSDMLGTVWSIIDIILSGVFIFVFGKQCVKIFNDFTNLRSGQIDTLYGGGN